jgi:glycerol-3-phosphate dehydrogenase subunit B
MRRLPSAHPYRSAGLSTVDRALSAFRVLASRGGVPYQGGLDGEVRLPTALGGLHATGLAPESLARGAIDQMTTFTVGALDGFRDFSADLVRSNIRRSGAPVPDVVSLPLIGDLPRRDLYAHDLARRFDDPEWRNELARAWKPRLGGVRLLGVPAVLGLLHHDDVISSLEEKLDLRLFEIPSLPPSVPGLRLEGLLRRVALATGVQLVEGPRAVGLVDGRSGGTRVAGVVTQAPGGPRTLAATSVLLATGGVLHGGLTSRQNGRFVESVFDLPIHHASSRADWTSTSPMGAQPYASYGLRVDSAMRPATDDGAAYFTNLFAAGGVLAAGDRAMEGSRQGIDLVTAFRAVESALGVSLP